MGKAETKQKILAKALELCQSRGFNGFSFHDLARHLGIKTSSIHYYFRKKSDLGVALITWYRESFVDELEQISASGGSEKSALKKFADKLAAVISEGKLCLCGMLASDLETISPEMRAELHKFFTAASAWVEQRLRKGKEKGEFSFKQDSTVVAEGIVSSLQGFMLCARVSGDQSKFKASSEWLHSIL